MSLWTLISAGLLAFLAAVVIGTGEPRDSEAMHPCGPAGIQGDANDDGAITSTDALLTLRTSVGYYVHSACGPYDVDCDHDIDSIDALKILRFLAGKLYTQVEPCPDIGTKAGGP